MVRVSIDVAATRDAITKMRTLAGNVESQGEAVKTDASAAHESVPSLAGLAFWRSHFTTKADEMDARVDLVIAVNNGDEGSGPISYDVPSDDPTTVRQQIGVEIGEYLSDMPDDPEGREDVEELMRWMTLMDKYDERTDVTSAMFEELGPEGTLAVPDQLRRFQQYYQERMSDIGGTMDDQDRFWDDDTIMTDKIEELQGQFMTTYSNSLGTASRGGYLDDNFAGRLADEVINGDNAASAWGLGQILRRGDYESDFLLDIANPIYEYERENDDQPLWGPRIGYIPNDSYGTDLREWTLGDDKTQFFDPFAGIFEAMGRNGDASLQFFDNNPDGGDDRDNRMDYFVDQRNWDHDQMNSVAKALDSAATSFRDPEDPRSERSAWIASSTIHELYERQAGEKNDREIGDWGKDSFGHILATYIADVDRFGAEGAGDGGVGTYDWSADGAAWAEGLPPGADFNINELRTVMTSVMQDTSAVDQVANATREFNSYRIGLTSEAYGDLNEQLQQARESGDQARIDALTPQVEEARSDFYGATQRSAGLQGFTLGTMETGTETAAHEADERVKRYLGLAGDVAGLIPAPGAGVAGEFAGFLMEQAIKQGSSVSEETFANTLDGVNLENYNVQQTAQNDLQMANLYALAENGLLPDEAMRPREGAEPYPWFVNGRFDPEIAQQYGPEFGNYLSNGSTGSEATRLIPDLSSSFSTGLENGSGDHDS